MQLTAFVLSEVEGLDRGSISLVQSFFMTKSQQYFQDMMENHKDLFDAFKVTHDRYLTDPKKYQQNLNELGEEELQIIRRYENMLCNQSEGGKYGKFSSKLSDTFWGYIRGQFPKIDAVGLQIRS